MICMARQDYAKSRRIWSMVCGMSRGNKRKVRKDRKGTWVLLVFATLATFALKGRAQSQALSAPTDRAAVERGGQLLREQCGFCHGPNARGGSGGPDLTRSTIVLDDDNGKQLGEFLRVGRPERGMPRFEFTPEQNTDLATFLHDAIYTNSN